MFTIHGNFLLNIIIIKIIIETNKKNLGESLKNIWPFEYHLVDLLVLKSNMQFDFIHILTWLIWNLDLFSAQIDVSIDDCMMSQYVKLVCEFCDF